MKRQFFAMSRVGICVIFCLLPAGCLSTAPRVTQEVKIPIQVKCITAVPARPAFESLALPGNAADGDKVLALARDTLLHFKYEGLLEAAIAGCL